MKKSFFKFQLIGFVVTVLCGVLLHFLYEWIPCFVTSIFSPINESITEHMKIIFTSTLVYGIIDYILLGNSDSKLCIIKTKNVKYNNILFLVFLHCF